MEYLSDRNFSTSTELQKHLLHDELDAILAREYHGNLFELMANYQRVLADNNRRSEWRGINDKLHTLFMAGMAVPMDGPMVGSTVSLRDSDYFREISQLFGRTRSVIANIEWMATAWNLTFSNTGLWMGKTFEPVSVDLASEKTGYDPLAMKAYNPNSTRIGRNFFRSPPDPNYIQSLGIPALTKLWSLRDRPSLDNPDIFYSHLSSYHAQKESMIPYTKTGGLFLADMGTSVIPEMAGKQVYQLNYRWPKLNPFYPVTRLIDEVVQIADGLYLGQLVYATRHYALWTLDINGNSVQIGEHYAPNIIYEDEIWEEEADSPNSFEFNKEPVNYKYQNNGYFLLMDPDYSSEIYAPKAFPQLQPRPGEHGYEELKDILETDPLSAYSAKTSASGDSQKWQGNKKLAKKFTHFITESSPKKEKVKIKNLLQKDESILQMLQRVSNEITESSKYDDILAQFEVLHSLFRTGVAPQIKHGLFQRHSGHYNTRLDSTERRVWYGQEDPCTGLDYYHGATLNLHWGFGDRFEPQVDQEIEDRLLFPNIFSERLFQLDKPDPNILNEMWQMIGRYVFPWAGKSFETVSARKLSMLLDESDNLIQRYYDRVKKIKNNLASAPHYAAIRKNHEHWDAPGVYAEHLEHGPWDHGMTDEDKLFWEAQSNDSWVFGNNLQDSRVLLIDSMMRAIDLNYGMLDPGFQQVANAGPSPFVRQGYSFLGHSNQDSILPMNNGKNKPKKVFQFQYRYPMIGGPAPIGFCLDEIVEIADGMFLGQLIYATRLDLPFHSSVPPEKYQYQLFGYFLLLDDDWQRHRLAIGLDTSS